MNIHKKIWVFLILGALWMTSAPVAAQLLDDRANVKILKTRSQLLLQNKHKYEQVANQHTQDLAGRVNCGSIDIGNDFSGGAGIGQDITVVITGDIINMGNRCISNGIPTN